MAHRLTRLAAAVLLTSLPLAAWAEEPATVGDLVQSVRAAADIADFATGDTKPDNDELMGALRIIEESDATAMTLEEAVRRIETPGLMAMSHRRSKDYSFSTPAAGDRERLEEAVRDVRRIAQGPLDDELGEKGLTEDERDVLLAPVAEYHVAKLDAAIAGSIEKLRRYEKRYGPGTPPLNGVELLLNYAVQSAPNFGPDDDGWPGALEIIAAYDTSYLTAVDEEPELLSVGELGLRCYMYAAGWGEQTGLAGFLKPGYVGLGLVVAGEDDGPFVPPWRGEPRFGGFLTWGALKLAYVAGDESRFMVSRELEFIPWLF